MAGTLERLDLIEKVAERHLQGFNYAQIGRELNLVPAHVKTLVDEYKTTIAKRLEEDPAYLERIGDNTLRTLDQLDMLHAEAWATYESAEKSQDRTSALKLAKEIVESRAKILQVLGGRADSGNMARLARTEKVNEIVSQVMKDVMGECPRCKVEGMTRLAEAFKLMNKAEEVVEIEEIEIPVEPHE